ncbi:MAG TPA: TIGR04283 family arsenosugar biosynthesis glycosyltransferase [Chloroflexota bacterium]|nr:TIGR04283 family arsenosugar biosynthesis glycosyltransferase [Chloroflexota bacterium]
MTSISIVVITLNEAPVIRECLDHVTAVVAQEGPGEVIVSDGGSTDETARIATAYPSVRVVAAPPGRAHGLNAGADSAAGEVLLFLHADTRLPQGALRAIRHALTDANVAGGRFMVALDNPALPFRIIGASINLRDVLLGGFTGDQAVFVRSRTFWHIGGYAPIPLMEDLDFARRLRQHGRVVRLPQHVTTSSRRWEQHGVLRTIARMWTLRALYYAGVSPHRLARHYRDAR